VWDCSLDSAYVWEMSNRLKRQWSPSAIEKSISTVLFIDRTATLYVGETQSVLWQMRVISGLAKNDPQIQNICDDWFCLVLRIFDGGLVESIFCGSGRVGFGQPFMVWVLIWKISPKNGKFFNFLPFGSNKISSGRVKNYRVCLLFTAGQK